MTSTSTRPLECPKCKGFMPIIALIDGIDLPIRPRPFNSGTRSWTSMTENWSFFPDRRASPWNWQNGIEAASNAAPAAAADGRKRASLAFDPLLAALVGRG
jgi:hypothetical protein